MYTGIYIYACMNVAVSYKQMQKSYRIYLSISIYVYMSLYLCIPTSTFLSIYLYAHLSIHRSIDPSISLPIPLTVDPSKPCHTSGTLVPQRSFGAV